MPVSCCSRICVTLLSRVAADAPGIGCTDVDLGRRDVGILGDRQRDDCADAHQHDDDRDHPGEDRAIDEDLRHSLAAAAAAAVRLHLSRPGGALTRCGAVAGTALICAPSLRFAVPCVITFSPGARPPVTTQLVPIVPLGLTPFAGPRDCPAHDEQCRIALRVARDGLLRDEDCGGLNRLGELRRHVHARKQDRLRVGKAGADRH